MDRGRVQTVPLQITSLAILSPANAPLYVHSFTGRADELRHYHLAHAALDVLEERIVMTSTPAKPADSYLGLLFCMEDMAFYGFQTPTRLRLILSVALIDALIKDADIVAVFRAVQHLILTTVNNPFFSLPLNFHARPAPQPNVGAGQTSDEREQADLSDKIVNPVVPDEKVFATGPEDIDGEWLRNSPRFQAGIRQIGHILSGGRS